MIKQERSGANDFLVHLGLVMLAAFLFALSFPNILIKNGFPFAAWVAYTPIFILIYRTSLRTVALWGALYGAAAYTLFNYWLTMFHPLAGLIAALLYAFYLAVVFVLLKLATMFFPRRGYIVQWIIWLAYEYLSTIGFLGYSYGVTGYSQWQALPIIQIASIFGVWGVSALVVFPSAWLAAALVSNNLSQRRQGAEEERGKGFFFAALRLCVNSFLKREKIPSLVWCGALIATLVFGIVSLKNYDYYPKANIALIQHNTDPWRGDIAYHRSNYETLCKLSNEALAAQPRPDMVVWSETAFVPRIYWHQTYRSDAESWLLVKDLLEYMAAQETPFLLGNDDARRDPSINPKSAENYRVDYNAAVYFDKGKIAGVYRKLHLVPFTEHFPYQKQLPAVYNILKAADTHFWEKGKDITVFSGPGFAFSSPICFEDTFGYLSRNFTRGGAEILVNLSNDAWSHSLPAQNQHLSMAVFRAVENNRGLARSTSSGQTCGIDPSGRIIALAPPFAEAWITVAIPVVKDNTTLYTRWGDFLGQGLAIMALALLIFGCISYMLRR